MENRKLGKTELQVSRVALGSMTFGLEVAETEAARIVDHCLDHGVNLVDTANTYGGGVAESVLGKVLRGRRHQVVLASKVGVRAGTEPEDAGLSRPAIRKAVNATLKRLATDYLDLYFLHVPDPATPIEDTLAVMEDLVQEGKVRYPAVSNFASWQVLRAMWHCDNRGYTPPMVTQQMYSLLTRGIEDEYLAFSRAYGLGLMVYSPLAAGLLTGKHRGSPQPPAGTRFEGNAVYRERYWHPEYMDAVEVLVDVAADAGLTLPELALRWLLAQPQVDSVILGATSLAQLEENLDSCEGPPPEPGAIERCDSIWEKLRGVSPRYNR
jgi:1-deoxyxylulose-5-phosphate synthase